MPLYGRNGHLLGDGSRLLGWCPGLAVGWAKVRFSTKDTSDGTCGGSLIESPPFAGSQARDDRPKCRESLASWNKPFALRLKVTGGDWWTFQFQAPFNDELFNTGVVQLSRSEFLRLSGGKKTYNVDINGGGATYSKPIWRFDSCSKIRVTFDRMTSNKGRMEKSIRQAWLRSGEDGEEYGTYMLFTYRPAMVTLDAMVEFYCKDQWFYWSPYHPASNFKVEILDASPNVDVSAGPADGNLGTHALVCS